MQQAQLIFPPESACGSAPSNSEKEDAFTYGSAVLNVNEPTLLLETDVWPDVTDKLLRHVPNVHDYVQWFYSGKAHKIHLAFRDRNLIDIVRQPDLNGGHVLARRHPQNKPWRSQVLYIGMPQAINVSTRWSLTSNT